MENRLRIIKLLPCRSEKTLQYCRLASSCNPCVRCVLRCTLAVIIPNNKTPKTLQTLHAACMYNLLLFVLSALANTIFLYTKHSPNRLWFIVNVFFIWKLWNLHNYTMPKMKRRFHTRLNWVTKHLYIYDRM